MVPPRLRNASRPIARRLHLAAAEGFHVDGLAAAVRLDETEPVMSEAEAVRLGIAPPYHFSTWEAIRPARQSIS